MQLEDPIPIKPYPIRQTIGVIAAIVLVIFIIHLLIPLGPGGNDASKSEICEGNLHNLAAAFAEYAQDYDGVYPHGVEKAASGVGWAGLIWPYVRNTASLACPSEMRSAPAGMTVDSYGYNSNIPHRPSESGDAAPSKTILLFEVSGANIRLDPRKTTSSQIEGGFKEDSHLSPTGNGIDGMLLDGTDAGATLCQYATGLLGNRAASGDNIQFDGDTGRHMDSANYCMADGHAALISGNHVSSGITALGSGDSQTGASEGRAAGSENSQFTATFSAR